LGLGASASRHLVKGIARYTIEELIHVRQARRVKTSETIKKSKTS
jgi:hypothetical protein